MPFYQVGHAPSSGIYALHPSNRTNQVLPMYVTYTLYKNIYVYTGYTLSVEKVLLSTKALNIFIYIYICGIRFS